MFHNYIHNSEDVVDQSVNALTKSRSMDNAIQHNGERLIYPCLWVTGI